MRRHEIKDEDWDRIKDMLPDSRGDLGVTPPRTIASHQRRPLDRQDRGPVADLAERFGPWGSVGSGLTAGEARRRRLGAGLRGAGPRTWR